MRAKGGTQRGAGRMRSRPSSRTCGHHRPLHRLPGEVELRQQQQPKVPAAAAQRRVRAVANCPAGAAGVLEGAGSLGGGHTGHAGHAARPPAGQPAAALAASSPRALPPALEPAESPPPLNAHCAVAAPASPVVKVYGRIQALHAEGHPQQPARVLARPALRVLPARGRAGARGGEERAPSKPAEL